MLYLYLLRLCVNVHDFTIFIIHFVPQCTISSTTMQRLFSKINFSVYPIISLLNGRCPQLIDPFTDFETSTKIATVNVLMMYNAINVLQDGFWSQQLSFSPGSSPVTTSVHNSISLFPSPMETISILISLMQLNEWKRLSLVTSTDGIIYEVRLGYLAIIFVT